MTPQDAFDQLSERFRKHPHSSISHRLGRLKALRSALLEHQEDIREALWKDFNKPHYEVDLTEIAATMFEVNHAIRHLRKWTKPIRKKTPIYLIGTSTEVVFQPNGPSLIITPWNYAFLLTMGPVIHAVAAGCPFVVKPSENTPNASKLLKKIIEGIFPSDEAVVFEGDAAVANALLDLPFSHIHFTGSVEVGKVVMKAGSKNLSSVTLELGGKSPVYVDETADLKAAARGICFGKFSNAGQTCIAPDYVLVHKSVRTQLLAELTNHIKLFYGKTSADRRSSNYARVINSRHFERLAGMLSESVEAGAHIVLGGETDSETRYIEPTILTDLPGGLPILRDEIFGPLLPVLSVSSDEEAITEIKSRPPPLSIYLFTSRSGLADHFSGQIRTGAVCANTTLVQFIQPFGPFGGEGNSGIGRSHGEAGFRAFCNQQVVMKRRWGAWIMHLFHPPYSARSTTFMNLLKRLG